MTAALIPGTVYYEAWADPDTGKVSIDTCVLRTLRGRYGYLITKNEFTWVKTGHGTRATWGWSKKLDPFWRTRFRIEEGIPRLYARSKSQAVRVALRDHLETMAAFPETDPEIIAADAKVTAALERRLKHEMRSKAR
jgi:hypothetical protein